MSFTARIRMILIAVALLPPALMMVVVYTYSSRQEESRYREAAADDLRKLHEYHLEFRDQLTISLRNVAQHTWFERSVRLIERDRASQVSFDDVRGFGLDFYEITDSTGTVVASADRPGLIGERMDLTNGTPIGDSARIYETIEYDINGRHASLSGTWRSIDGYVLYGGYYVERHFLPTAQKLLHGRLEITFPEDQATASPRTEIRPGSLFRINDTLQALLFAENQAAYFVAVTFERPDQSAAMLSFTKAISAVALASVLAAVALGIFISIRTRREFDNLVDAFGRVAGGDLDTTVMAYSEGEFSQLADSFSEMTRKLRLSQERLATSEKIAAWQSLARKIAHEIKNPLTPIGLSADDLRRSYQEQLPGFDQTLDNNTRLIKSEVNRLTRLLDEFVSFARMKPPEFQSVTVTSLVDKLQTLYQSEIANGRFTVDSHTGRNNVRLDPDLITQLLVNLIKNGLEANEASKVTMTLSDDNGALQITVTDTGPGFSETVLARQFEPYLSSKKGGSGLGLAICQRIAYDHGGRIELKNRTEGGAEVTVRLPQD
jgi:signal transduction histidine kinase